MINLPDVPAPMQGRYWCGSCEYCGADLWSYYPQPDDLSQGDPDYQIEHDCPQAPPDEYA